MVLRCITGSTQFAVHRYQDRIGLSHASADDRKVDPVVQIRKIFDESEHRTLERKFAYKEVCEDQANHLHSREQEDEIQRGQLHVQNFETVGGA